MFSVLQSLKTDHRDSILQVQVAPGCISDWLLPLVSYCLWFCQDSVVWYSLSSHSRPTPMLGHRDTAESRLGAYSLWFIMDMKCALTGCYNWLFSVESAFFTYYSKARSFRFGVTWSWNTWGAPAYFFRSQYLPFQHCHMAAYSFTALKWPFLLAYCFKKSSSWFP